METPHNAVPKQFYKVQPGEVFIFYGEPYLKINNGCANQAVNLLNNHITMFFDDTVVHVCPSAKLVL